MNKLLLIAAFFLINCAFFVSATCGNNLIETNEECDSGSLNGNDFCTYNCTFVGGTRIPVICEFMYNAIAIKDSICNISFGNIFGSCIIKTGEGTCTSNLLLPRNGNIEHYEQYLIGRLNGKLLNNNAYNGVNYFVNFNTEDETDYCTDSDGGQKWDIKGTATLISGSVEEDRCITVYGNPNVLRENYCKKGINQILQINYGCPKKCYNGACVDCAPDCSGKDCGDDGCGRTCGSCTDGKNCSNEKCILICSENWNCTVWGECLNNQQTRTCTDMNNCGTTSNKPLISQFCEKPPVYIANKKVLIERGERINTLQIEEQVIETSLTIIEDSSKVYIQLSSGSKEEVKILPEEAKIKATKIESSKNIKIEEENNRAVYVISGVKTVRLFFLFPIEAKVEQKIDIKNGEVVSTKKPWWHIFALGI
ncbi:MAG: hypothetical protein NT076_00705 [Candidatus Pacearchaeota archaeon]|nr:hypothetical protein [Candidatus Pacearchaeota archaeon]